MNSLKNKIKKIICHPEFISGSIGGSTTKFGILKQVQNDKLSIFSIFFKNLQLISNMGILYLLLFPLLVHAEFADVDTTHPYYHAISALEESQVVEGYLKSGQYFFKPLQAVNRAEAAKILILAAGIDLSDNDKLYFEDVRFSDWYSSYVNIAAERKIVKGFTDSLYHPSAQVSRAEFLKMTLVAFGRDIPAPKEEEQWFDPIMNLAQKYRLTTATEPHENLVRGEVAEIIYRTRLVSDNGFADPYVFTGHGLASFYAPSLAGQPTSNGEVYDPEALTAAHRTLPFETRLKVRTNDNPEKYVIVKVNDRGPYHEDRVLDLSQRAFEKLAPTGLGVMEVDFQVYTQPTDPEVIIPESIRPALEDETKATTLPDFIAERVSLSSSFEENPDPVVTKPLFKEPYSSIGSTFFNNVKLRYPIPQRVYEGTVVSFAGTTEFRGAKQVSVFLQKIEAPLPPQKHFKRKVSGKNFVVPVLFLEPGKFQIGVVFDDETESRIAEIEVVPKKNWRKFPSSNVKYQTNLNVRLIPETQKIALDFDTDKDRVTKIVFGQDTNKIELNIENGLNSVEVPYEFFKDFESISVDSEGDDVDPLAIDVFQAKSLNGTLEKQTSNWQKVAYQNYQIVEGFPDSENLEKISIRNFKRFVHDRKSFNLIGRILDNETELPAKAYLTLPNGQVKEIDIDKHGDEFSILIAPLNFGTYILEIITDQGEIIFNRAIYLVKEEVLPIKKWPQSYAKSPTPGSVRNWINYLRKEHGVKMLEADIDLNDFAQSYATSVSPWITRC